MNPPRTLQIPAPDQAGIRQDVAMGILCALFNLLFGDAIAALISELQALFDAFRAGTLPPAPAPLPRPACAPVPQAASVLQAKPAFRRQSARPRNRARIARPAPVRAGDRARPPMPRAHGAPALASPARSAACRAHPPPAIFRKSAFAWPSSHVQFVT